MPELLTEGNPQPAPQQTPEVDNSDSRWFKTANANFRHAETYKSRNCERRYRISDDLYLAATDVKYWEGTKVRRSSMPVYLALSQIEALLPHVVGAMFNDDLPFAARPFPGTTMDQARAAMELIRWQMLWMDPRVGPVPFITLREIFRRGYKSDLIYGNQVIEFGWLKTQRPRVRYEKQLVPERGMLSHPILGDIPVPTGRFNWQVNQQTDTEIISKPIAQHVDIRDFYWDPNCPSSCIQEARYAARRQFPTVTELLSFSGQPGFSSFTKEDLLNLAKKKSERPSDQSKRATESSRGNSWSPTLEYNDNPDLCRLETIRYVQPDRIVWFVPGAEPDKDNGAVLYNAPNEYGMINFLTSAYTDVPGRWNGLSICDLLEGEQHLAMSLLDSRIDELNLIIHAPIVRRTGTLSSSTQKRFRPGAEFEINGKPGEDFIRMEMGNVTAQAFVEVDALDRRAQKTTGVTDSAVVGTSTTGGNSALRSATGVSALSQAAGTRIEYQVENKQDHILVPLVYAIHWLNRRFLDPAQTTQILGPDWAQLVIDNTDVMNAEVMFEWQAGARRRTKQSLQSGGLQVVMSTLLAAPLVDAMAQQGIRPNYQELNGLVCDAMNLPPKTLWVPMTPQEQQAYQAREQAQMQLKQQLQSERLQAMAEMKDSSDDSKLLADVLKKILLPEVVAKLAKDKGEPDVMRLIEAKVAPKEPANANAK